MKNLLFQKNIVSVDDLSVAQLEQLFSQAAYLQSLKRPYPKLLSGKIVANLFFEASTRSRMSFSSAFLYLGGQVNSTTGFTFSSISKGESIEDSMKVISSYCDVIVLRHPEIGTAQIAAKASHVPVINAGDGHGEHPTQALLDLYTIYKETNRLSDLKIVMAGDLKYGRTIHSLSKLLALYPNIHICFSAPESLQIPSHITRYLQERNVEISSTDDIKEAIKDADIIYSTRIQKERLSETEETSSTDLYKLDLKTVTTYCKNTVKILHPLPRLDEISTDLDQSPYCAYFRQAENGLYLRMALFAMILNPDLPNG